MGLPAADVAQVQAWCEGRVPAAMRDQVRVACDVDAPSLTIVEEHPPWDGAGGWTRSPVARLRYVARRSEWTLYCVGATGDFRRYDPVQPASSVGPLLSEIERDTTAIFWG
ncbi:MAG: hypothetical protein JWN77_2818 [Frankiales bacterium]|jgi:hypothetical protein|nr:hypothetical protein [Frankiales bacterium]